MSFAKFVHQQVFKRNFFFQGDCYRKCKGAFFFMEDYTANV